jgi:hypothetical protein
MDLAVELPRLLPLAVAWAEENSTLILRDGIPLSEQGTQLALLVGVKDYARVRILLVHSIPAPSDPVLQAACAQLQFLEPNTHGLTLGFGIFVKKGFETGRGLIAHELRHVAQYEQYFSIGAYLSDYIPELIRFGYAAAPLELDAQRAAARCT